MSKTMSVGEHRERRLRAGLALAVAVGSLAMAGINAKGISEGGAMPEAAPATAGEALEAILSPVAREAGALILGVNERGTPLIGAEPTNDGNGGVRISFTAWTHDKKLNLEAEMLMGQNGKPDASTTYETDIMINYCNPPDAACDGDKNAREFISIYHGADNTPTHGAWGVSRSYMPAGSSEPTQSTLSRVRNPNEGINTDDARQAIAQAKAWSRVIKYWSAASEYPDKWQLPTIILPDRPPLT